MLFNCKLNWLIRNVANNQVADGTVMDFTARYDYQSQTNADMKKLAEQVLVHKNCPENLTINLRSNHKITDEGAQYILDALQSGNCKPGLKISLSKTSVTQALRARINEALASGTYCHKSRKIEYIK